ncbi:MAG: DMT family transporter [Candidatus Midichloria sp.]|nr:MAG: DMT family transporter [Candidatus Midichloria sp.]
MSYQNAKGIGLMIINALSLAVLYAIMKMVTVSLNSNQAVFFYKFSVFLFILPWIFYKDGIKSIQTPNLKMHFYRSIFSTTGSLTLMHSLNYLKLIDITVLTHLEQMLWLIIGTLFFNEKLNSYKVGAILFGFAGGFLIVRPELIHHIFFGNQIKIPEFNKAYIFIAITILCWSINSTLVKVLGHRKASNKAQLFYVMLFASLFSYIVAFVDWHLVNFLGYIIYVPGQFYSPLCLEIETWQIAGIAASALFYLIHNVAFFNAMKYGEMTVIAPFVYFKLVFVGILGYLIFNEVPKMAISYFGYSFIVIAGMLLIWSQYKQHKKN